MDTVKFQYGLGDRVKDRISGLTGIIVARTQHLYGCVRYWVAPETTKDGKPAEGAWLDEPSLEVLQTEVHMPHNVFLPDVVSQRISVEPEQRNHGFDLPSSRR